MTAKKITPKYDAAMAARRAAKAAKKTLAMHSASIAETLAQRPVSTPKSSAKSAPKSTPKSARKSSAKSPTPEIPKAIPLATTTADPILQQWISEAAFQQFVPMIAAAMPMIASLGQLAASLNQAIDILQIKTLVDLARHPDVRPWVGHDDLVVRILKSAAERVIVEAQRLPGAPSQA